MSLNGKYHPVRKLHPQWRARMCLQVFAETLAEKLEEGCEDTEARRIAAERLVLALQMCWEEEELDQYLKPAQLMDTLAALNREQEMDAPIRQALRLDDPFYNIN